MPYNPTTHRFFLMTVDPVHVGTGGMRLGRVDNSIAREPGTRVPKIPGTALHGAIRAYAAHRLGKPYCAGQGQKGNRKHCGRPTCPICYTFGYAHDQEGGSSGVVAIGDARILLFPVYSMVGPVWVTCPSVLHDAGFGRYEVSSDKAKWGGNSSELPSGQPINLGWLMVEREGGLSQINMPDEIPEQIHRRIVLVSDKLFSQIVNSNLEVRTSVAINPETGAAEERALFTYEAIPRAAILWMDVVVSDFKGKFPSKEKITKCWKEIESDWKEEMQSLPDAFPAEKEEKIKRAIPVLREVGFKIDKEIPSENRQKETFWKQFKGVLAGLCNDASRYDELGGEWKSSLDVVVFGVQWMEHLGVGGMGTRGFGRMRKL